MPICPVCNQPVTKDDRKYCSRRCWIASKKNIKQVICLDCGAVFRPTTNLKANKFCSKKCYWNNMTKEYRGTNCSAWNGGKTAPDKIERGRFKREVQKVIFERDNYTCLICGIKGTDMQVDHIKSWLNYPEFRFDTENCRTLCAKCHYKETFGNEMPDNVKKWGHNLTAKK